MVVIFRNSHDIRPSNGKISGKVLEVMGPFSRLWKGLDDIRKAPSDETVEVPVDKFVTLVEQVILLLGQATLSSLTFLKMITKDPRKAKPMVKENQKILKESETHTLGKKFRSHMTEIEKSKKKSLEALARRNLSFEKALPRIKINRIVKGAITTWGKFQSPFQHNKGRKFQQ